MMNFLRQTKWMVVSVAVVAVGFGAAWAQSRGDAKASFGGKSVSVNYGRPELRGRDMLGQAKDGMVWRFGSNQATTLTTEADLMFGSLAVPAGSYSLFAKKINASSWHLILNEQTGQWGTQRDASRDLGEVPFSVSQSGETVEKFTIEIEGSGSQGTLKAMWGATVLAVSFTVK